VRPLLGAGSEKVVLALVCWGYPDDPAPQPAKKGLQDKITYLN